MKKSSVFTAFCILSIFFAECDQTAVNNSRISTDGMSDESSAIAADIVLDDILNAYAEEYLATSEIPMEALEAEFGLTSDMYAETKGMMPVMSTHNDRIAIVKAKADQTDLVEQTLPTANQEIIDITMQYPMNVPKTNATQVVRHGDCVAFLLAGTIDDFTDPEGEEAQQHTKQQVKTAVDAFNSAFSA